MNHQKIFQFNLELFKVTGIQRVLLDIHEALKYEYNAKIVGNIPFNQVNDNLGISEWDYKRFRNPFMFHNSIVIIHERRLLPLLWLLTHLPGLNVKGVYIHHSELYSNKYLSFFPKNIVAISDAGIRNLTDYFRVKPNRITKIHNCVREGGLYSLRKGGFNPKDIKILYPARINSGKRQVEIIKHLKGKLDHRVKILFAGTGPQYEELKEVCRDNDQFLSLGFVDNIPSLLLEVDFIMLFSRQEGLPISLIEATMVGVPAICNNVGGNTEIIKNNENGIIVNDWLNLLETLNSLPNLSQDDIKKMQDNSRNRYLKFFSFNIFKRKYLDLIKGI